MPYAVFDKTMENMHNHDVRLVTCWDGRYGAEAMIAKPNFHNRSIFSENLVAIEMRKLEVKPIYVGMCILDIDTLILNISVVQFGITFLKDFEFAYTYRVTHFKSRECDGYCTPCLRVCQQSWQSYR